MKLKPLHLGLAALAGFSAYALWWEPAMMMRVVRWRVGLPQMRGKPPIRLVIISDLHAGAPHISLNRVSRIVDRANALNPDVAILLGDYAAAHPFTWGGTNKRDIISRLKDFTSPNGLYSVVGNHDWWQDAAAQKAGYGPVEAERELMAAGIPVLDNLAVQLNIRGTPFWLAGLAEQRPFKSGPSEEGFDDLEKTLGQVTDDAPVVLLAHEPDIFDHLDEVPRRVDLTISGHTHGGQIRVMGGAPLINASDNEKWSWGRYDDDGGRALIVSAGIGCSVLPMRLGVPPELTVIDLCAPDENTDAQARDAYARFDDLRNQGEMAASVD